MARGSKRQINFVLAGDAKGLQRTFTQATKASDKFAKDTDRHHKQVSSSFGGMAKSALKGAAGITAAYVSISQAKNAISSTQDLVKATGALHRNLGFTNKEASAWAAVAKARGIDNKALTMSFTALSKQIEGATAGGDKQQKLFKTLGISTNDLKRTHGDFNAQLSMVADGLGKLRGGTERQAAAQQLLGRGYQTILPLFTEGSKSMREQLKLAEEYGVTLDKRTLEPVKKLTAAQRELKFAQMGLQVAFTRQTAPALLSLEKALLRVLKITNDPNLTAAEKWEKLGKIVGPMADKLSQGVLDAIPKIADRVGEQAPKVASAFVRGFVSANVWGKLAIGAFLLTKFGGWGAFTGAGRKGGGSFGEGFSKGAAGRMKSIGRNVLAVDLAVGIAAGLSAKGPATDRIQTAFSAMTMGLVPEPVQDRLRSSASLISKLNTQVRRLGSTDNAAGLHNLAKQVDVLSKLDWFDAKQLQAFRRQIDRSGQSLESLRDNFSRMRKGSVTSLRELRKNVDSNMTTIARLLDVRSERGSKALTDNTKLAIRSVKRMMKDGSVSTAEGMATIQKLFERTMALYGISGNQAKHDAAARAYHAVTGGSTHATNATHGNATGGWIGQPGERGGDNVPAWLGRGEAVLNRHQQQPVEMALRTVYGMGLDDLFQREQRPHYLATGGRAGGLRPGIASAVRKVTSKFPLTVTSTTGGTHAPGSFHYRGMAADLGGSPTAMNAASQWIKSSGMARSLAEGIHNPNLSVKGGQMVPSSFWGPGTWAGHANHIHLAIAGALGALTGGGSATIPKVTVKGPASPLRSIIQATLNKSRAGANRYIADQLAAMDPGAEAGSGAGGGGAGSKANMQLGKRMLDNASQWPALRTLWMGESGWDNYARNPSSGAYGIPQALPASKMGDAANPPKSDPGAQITWGLRYIAGRYGTPSKALAAWRSRSPHWYARGGFGGRGGHYETGGIVAAHHRGPKDTVGRYHKTYANFARYATQHHWRHNLGTGAWVRLLQDWFGLAGTPSQPFPVNTRLWRDKWYRGDRRARGGFAGRSFARGGRSTMSGGPSRPRRPVRHLQPVRGGTKRPPLGGIFEINGADEVGMGAYEAPEPFTPLDFAEAAAADATLTDTLVDDIDAAGAILGLAQTEYDAAVRSNDPRRRSAAAGTLKQARDNLAALKGQQQDLVDALKANTEATQALADESKRTNDFNARVESITGTEAVKAMADVMSGYLGQKAGQRIRTPGRGYVASA